MGYARGLREKKHLAAAAEAGQQCYREAHDAQAAYPLREAAPEQDAVGQALDVVKDGGSGGREPRHRFKECVSHRRDVAADKIRKHAEDGKEHPRQRHDNIRFRTAQLNVAATPGYIMSVHEQASANQCADDHGYGKRKPVTFAVQ